jgi:large repetitive protein
LRRYVPAFAAALLIAGICATGAGWASAATVIPAETVPADTGASAIALTLSAPSVEYGDEQTEVFTVTATGAGGAPTGTATISVGAVTVCTIALADGSGTCAPTADELAVGSVTLTAAYSGDANYDPSTSPAADLQVVSPPPPLPSATTTSLALAKAAISYGDEQAETISVKVAAVTDGSVTDGGGAVPAGSVIVADGAAKLCAFILSPSGTGACSLKATVLLPGKAELTAAYAGAPAFAASVSAGATLTVAKEPTAAAVALSASKVTFGDEQRERITVAVKPAYAGTPTGHVTVKAGSTAICVITLKSGRGTCSPSATRLGTGRHSISAVYGGSNDVVASVSGPRVLSVAKASSTTALSLSAAQVQYGSEGTEKISVQVAAKYSGTPGGTVTVRANGDTLAVIKLKSGAGSYALSAKGFAAGTYELVASYVGNADFNGSTSAKQTLTVTSPPPPPPACYPLSSKGTCYEPGEFCPEADHGETGIAGDGEQIICEDNDGWRWEPLD